MWPFLNHSLRLVPLAGPSCMQVHLYNLQFYKASKNNFLVNFEMFLLNGLWAKTILWMTHFFCPICSAFFYKRQKWSLLTSCPLMNLGSHKHGHTIHSGGRRLLTWITYIVCSISFLFRFWSLVFCMFLCVCPTAVFRQGVTKRCNCICWYQAP